jgi:hypothetical protein
VKELGKMFTRSSDRGGREREERGGRDERERRER